MDNASHPMNSPLLAPDSAPDDPASRPEGTKVILSRTGRSCYVEVPPTPIKGWAKIVYFVMFYFLIVGGFNVAYGVSMLFYHLGSRIGVCRVFCGLVGVVIGLWMHTELWRWSHLRSVLRLGDTSYTLRQEVTHTYIHRRYSDEEDPDLETASGNTCDLELATLGMTPRARFFFFFAMSSRPCIMVGPQRSRKCFGEGLSYPELEWIIEEVNATITEAKYIHDPSQKA